MLIRAHATFASRHPSWGASDQKGRFTRKISYLGYFSPDRKEHRCDQSAMLGWRSNVRGILFECYTQPENNILPDNRLLCNGMELVNGLFFSVYGNFYGRKVQTSDYDAHVTAGQ